MDRTTANGLAPEAFAKKLIHAVEKEKEEVTIAQAREKLAVLLKRLLPKMLSRVVRKVAVT